MEIDPAQAVNDFNHESVEMEIDTASALQNVQSSPQMETNRPESEVEKWDPK